MKYSRKAVVLRTILFILPAALWAVMEGIGHLADVLLEKMCAASDWLTEKGVR